MISAREPYRSTKIIFSKSICVQKRYPYMWRILYGYSHVPYDNCREITTSPQFTKSANSDFLVSRDTNSNGEFSFIWICTEEFEFLDLVDFWGVAFSVESVMWMTHVSYKWMASLSNVPCRIWIGNVAHEWVSSHMNESRKNKSGRNMNEPCHIWMRHVPYEWVMSQMHGSCRSYRCLFCTHI